MKYKRIDKLKDGEWVLKHQNYTTIKKAKHIEDKLELLRQVINEVLEERWPEKIDSFVC